MHVAAAVPGVHLERAARVGEVDEAVWVVARPLREHDPRGTEPLLPARLVLDSRTRGGERLGHEGIILLRSSDHAPRPVTRSSHVTSVRSYSGLTASIALRPPSVGACAVPASRTTVTSSFPARLAASCHAATLS